MSSAIVEQSRLWACMLQTTGIAELGCNLCTPTLSQVANICCEKCRTISVQTHVEETSWRRGSSLCALPGSPEGEGPEALHVLVDATWNGLHRFAPPAADRDNPSVAVLQHDLCGGGPAIEHQKHGLSHLPMRRRPDAPCLSLCEPAAPASAAGATLTCSS